jgi:hypothetical protein
LEFVVATQLRDKNHECIADVYGTYIDNETMYIVLEKVDTESIDDIFAELIQETFNQGIDGDILSIDEDEIQEPLSNKALQMLNDINIAMMEYQERGYNVNDINPNNMGLKSNGRYALFDQRDNSMSVPLAVLEIKKALQSDTLSIMETLEEKAFNTLKSKHKVSYISKEEFEKRVNPSTFEQANNCSLDEMMVFDDEVNFLKITIDDQDVYVIENMINYQLYSKKTLNLKPKTKNKKIMEI